MEESCPNPAIPVRISRSIRVAHSDLCFQSYWDWAAPQVETEGMPKVLSYETLRILGPGGSTLRVRNPLRSYRFEAPPDDAPPSNYKGELRVYFDEWKRTYRWATGKNDPQEDYMQLDTYAALFFARLTARHLIDFLAFSRTVPSLQCRKRLTEARL